MKVYFYPTVHKGKASNPYSKNYKDAISEYFELVDDYKVPLTLNYPFLHYAFKADVFILNWVESVIFSKYGLLKFIVILLALCVIRLRRKKIVWMLHNLQPHEGENSISRFLQNYLFRHSSLIMAHSRTACDFAKTRAKCEVEYYVHPVTMPIYEKKSMDVPSCDVLIWGAVLPYKGILEFISKPQVQQSSLRIRIIGICKDKKLADSIAAKCSNLITYENRRIDFTELKALMDKARYVLFPYVGLSVSSSGALIDTICLGGVPIGPNTGAFKDLEEEGVCVTYTNDDDMMDLLMSNKNLIDESVRQEFIRKNSWESFAQKLAGRICKLK